MPLEKLTRDRIIAALNLLGKFAQEEQVTLELCVYGGSAMMLAYGSRDVTKDVDAIVKPAEVAVRLARKVADQLGLDESWLNNDVRMYVSEFESLAPIKVEELEEAAQGSLKITRPSAAYLLAMKCLACRPPFPGYPGDLEDIRFLIRKMNISSIEEIEQHLDRFYPHEAFTPKVRETLEGLVAAVNSERHSNND
jgi:hypothetical protein